MQKPKRGDQPNRSQQSDPPLKSTAEARRPSPSKAQAPKQRFHPNEHRQTPAQPRGLRPFSTLCLSSPQWVAFGQSVDNSGGLYLDGWRLEKPEGWAGLPAHRSANSRFRAWLLCRDWQWSSTLPGPGERQGLVSADQAANQRDSPWRLVLLPIGSGAEIPLVP